MLSHIQQREGDVATFHFRPLRTPTLTAALKKRVWKKAIGPSRKCWDFFLQETGEELSCFFVLVRPRILKNCESYRLCRIRVFFAVIN